MTGKKFEVDDEGFKNQMSEMELWRLIQEIVSNEFDEKSVSNVRLSMFDDGHNIVVIVEGNGDGFRDIKEIYTLFGDSYKRTNKNQRGRYNLGDKQFLSVCERATVMSNEHIVSFGSFGRKEETNASPIKGTKITGYFKNDITDDQFEEVLVELKKVAVPEGIEYIVNDEIVKPREIIKSFNTKLRTPVASGKNQKLVDEIHDCEVRIYPLLEDEEPMIMELGVQINKFAEKNLDWHVDIRQKVPIPISRNMVTPKYLTVLYSKILENTLDLLNTDDELSSDWINDGLKKVDEESGREFLVKKFGTDKICIESENDVHANETAQDNGYKVIPQVFSREIMKNLGTKLELIKYAGKEFKTGIADSKPVSPNPDMVRFADVVKKIGKFVLKRKINVSFMSAPDATVVADFGHNTMRFNVPLIPKGMKGFKKIDAYLLGLIIHELAHGQDPHNPICSQYSHYTSDYLKALENVAGMVAMKGIEYFLKQEVLAK